MGQRSNMIEVRGQPADDNNPVPVGTRWRPNLAAAHEGPLTVGSTAADLTALMTLHDDTRSVFITVEDAALRLTVNGTTPTATLGFNFVAGVGIRLSRNEVATGKVIRAGGTDAKIQVAQYL
jgi:hypothetical protein